MPLVMLLARRSRISQAVEEHLGVCVCPSGRKPSRTVIITAYHTHPQPPCVLVRAFRCSEPAITPIAVLAAYVAHCAAGRNSITRSEVSSIMGGEVHTMDDDDDDDDDEVEQSAEARSLAVLLKMNPESKVIDRDGIKRLSSLYQVRSSVQGEPVDDLDDL